MWAIARIAPPDGRMARVDALTERNKSRGKGRYHQQMTLICRSGNFGYQLFIYVRTARPIAGSIHRIIVDRCHSRVRQLRSHCLLRSDTQALTRCSGADDEGEPRERVHCQRDDQRAVHCLRLQPCLSDEGFILNLRKSPKGIHEVLSQT